MLSMIRLRVCCITLEIVFNLFFIPFLLSTHSFSCPDLCHLLTLSLSLRVSFSVCYCRTTANEKYSYRTNIRHTTHIIRCRYTLPSVVCCVESFAFTAHLQRDYTRYTRNFYFKRLLKNTFRLSSGSSIDDDKQRLHFCSPFFCSFFKTISICLCVFGVHFRLPQIIIPTRTFCKQCV